MCANEFSQLFAYKCLFFTLAGYFPQLEILRWGVIFFRHFKVTVFHHACWEGSCQLNCCSFDGTPSLTHAPPLSSFNIFSLVFYSFTMMCLAVDFLLIPFEIWGLLNLWFDIFLEFCQSSQPIFLLLSFFEIWTTLRSDLLTISFVSYPRFAFWLCFCSEFFTLLILFSVVTNLLLNPSTKLLILAIIFFSSGISIWSLLFLILWNSWEHCLLLNTESIGGSNSVTETPGETVGIFSLWFLEMF